ncbi:fluoride efflux transporter CrcB [Allorhizobium taibaishanense]|uniref:Fluoride-specific ion channel FluC n=1 Tax=Allorhizobium taibaishanense TaxID=887144 RepID=A0A1Q9AAQ5_9HYPH|nr:fluoride efflux transporter CrcB [Allorhizobium taibaishanense]MBB4007124.1 CrcB protein [Allorhizobium taibaishanense]OLP51911.1 protein CrcB [Allorhizobium taibaishanense]
MIYLVVFLGAGLGGVLRQAVNVGAARLLGFGFPWGTLTVNIAGSIAMGLLAEFFVVRSGLPQELRLFLTTGILGGFTTFSTFTLDAVTLWDRGQWGLAVGYVSLSLILSLVGLVAGITLIRLIGQGQAG